MSFPRRLLQYIEYSASDPEIRIRPYPDPVSNLIRRAESHPLDIIRETVWIFTHNRVYLLPVFLIDPDRQIHCNTILLQKNHRLAQIPFFIDLMRDLHGFPLTDPLNLSQTFRLLFNNAKRVRLKAPHNSGGKRQPDSLYCTGTKIALNSLRILRHPLLKMIHLKLPAIRGVLRILTGSLNRFSLRNRGKHPYTYNFLFPAHQTEYRITVIRISVYNMLHIT